jgi:hypothetical protein
MIATFLGAAIPYERDDEENTAYYIYESDLNKTTLLRIHSSGCFETNTN